MDWTDGLVWTSEKSSPLLVSTSQVSRDVSWTDQYWKLVFDMLYRSSRTLEKVTMDGNSAFKLKKFAERMQPLRNVTSLTLSIHENSRRSGISEFLLPVPLGQIFPTVTTVWIDMDCNYGIWGVGGDIPDNYENGIFRWPAVTQLTLQGGSIWDEKVRELATLFPNLRTLNHQDGKCYSFREIWPSFPSR